MQTLRVLIVEDESHMRVAVSRALGRFSLELPDVEGEIRFAVEEAGSAEDGLAAITRQCPDLLLLDHKLPGMSGVELLEILAGQQPDLLTVMMTAYATLETAVVATKRGAFDFLAKPFTPDELKSAVGKAARHLILQRETRRLAQERRHLRFQFISVLVHELKAPLAAIQGYLYLLQNRTVTEEAAYDRVIERSLLRVEGMRKLIMDLLDLTRLESGQKKRDLVSLDLVEVARTAIETVQAEAAARSIAIALHADRAVPIRADRGEMEIVLNNLVTNAVKYNRAGGRVDVVLSAMDSTADGSVGTDLDTPAGGRVAIEVRDTGIGMTEEECARLFQEFMRIRNDKTRGIMGSGLGLSIVRRLARLYGGDVRVTSRPDEGSVFRVELLAEAPVDSAMGMELPLDPAGAGLPPGEGGDLG